VGWTSEQAERALVTLYRDSAVVIRTHDLGEADRIVVLLTAEHGKVRAVAKGVRKTKSRFGGRLEPLSHVNLLLYRGRGELDVVNQAESVEGRRELLADLDRLTQGLAMLEAVDRLTPDREPVPQLYRMLAGALRTLSSTASPLVVPAFFWKVLADEGVRPELDHCVRCGEEGALVAFDLHEGGALCRSCRQGSAISPGALALMQQILGGQLNAALAAPASPVTHEVSMLATRAMEHHLEHGLRVVALLERH